MNLIQTFWLGFSFLSTTTAASELLADLNCSVTKQPDGSFLYRLSRPPASARCETGWEDHNKTAFSHGSSSHPDLVQNWTSQSISVKACQDYMHYTESCLEGFQEAYCRVNCSLLMVEDHLPHTVNSTLTCVFGSWCPDQLTVGLGTTGFLLIVAVVIIGLKFRKFFKCRRGESANEETSYTPVRKLMKTATNREETV